MKNLGKLWLGILAIMLVFSGCPETDPGPGSGPGPKEYGPLENVVYTMRLEENADWNKPGNEDWSRWLYNYQDEDDLFDLSDMLDNDKVYILSYSFSSNINIDELFAYFWNMDHTDWDWQMISNFGNIEKPMVGGTKYNGTIAFLPQSNAEGLEPRFTYLSFNALNRSVATAAVLYFYQFDLEKVDKDISDLDEWSVSGETFTIDTDATKAESLSAFETKSNVLQIKPTYDVSRYPNDPIHYDLSSYKGKTIEIEMSMDVYLKKEAWVAWQINSSPTPFYPVVCGKVATDARFPDDSGPALSANTWHSLTGSYTYTVPNTDSGDDNGKLLYLSGQQIKGAEAYFANATITITEK